MIQRINKRGSWTLQDCHSSSEQIGTVGKPVRQVQGRLRVQDNGRGIEGRESL